MNRRVDGVVAHGPIARGRHAFYVPTGTKPFTGARENDNFHGAVQFKFSKGCGKGRIHCSRHRVARFGSIQSDDAHAIGDVG